MTPPSPIKVFLAQLRVRLQVSPSLAERIVAEVEDHLLDLVNELESSGLTGEQAAHQVVARFGTPEEIASAFHYEDGRMKTSAFRRSLAIRISIYLAVASAACFFFGWYAGLEPRLPATQQVIRRVWLQQSYASVPTVWFRLGLGTLAFALGASALAWREWKGTLIRSRAAKG